jgi:hypothetical protein
VTAHRPCITGSYADRRKLSRLSERSGGVRAAHDRTRRFQNSPFLRRLAATWRQSLTQFPRRKAAAQRIRLSSFPSASSATVQLKLILNPVDGLFPQGTRQADTVVKKPRAERGDTFSIFCGYQRILPGGPKTNHFSLHARSE